MRSKIFSGLLVAAMPVFGGMAVANAALVNFDDSLTNNNGAYVDSQGFRFAASDGLTSLATQQAYWGSALQFCGYCGGDFISLSMNAIDGSAFRLNSFETEEYFFGGDHEISVTGYYVGGGSVSTTFSILDAEGPVTGVFDSSWSDLQSVVFTSANPVQGVFFVDNLNASVVPIPAAIWLFGSALAGLGWIRRRQTV